VSTGTHLGKIPLLHTPLGRRDNPAERPFTVTLSQGIETAIIEAVPEITSVLDVTDHQSGTNPYFEAAKK
jgi:hypothetical protein